MQICSAEEMNSQRTVKEPVPCYGCKTPGAARDQSDTQEGMCRICLGRGDRGQIHEGKSLSNGL